MDHQEGFILLLKYNVIISFIPFLILAKDTFQPFPEILVAPHKVWIQSNPFNSSFGIKSHAKEEFFLSTAQLQGNVGEIADLSRLKRENNPEEADNSDQEITKKPKRRKGKKMRSSKKKKSSKKNRRKEEASNHGSFISSANEPSSSVEDKVDSNPFSKDVTKFLGRSRISASLGSFRDFSTSVIDSGNDFEITEEIIELAEELKEFQFRGEMKQRSLSAKVKRWPHKEGLDPKYPDVCGFPVCSIIDSRPKRFKSLCHLVAYLKEEGKSRRVVEVQKGGCEDAIEGIGHDRPWASEKVEKCSSCKDHKVCGTQLCINDNGHAKTFPDVCHAMQYLHNKTKLIVAAIGLGDCKTLYSSCLYTEWWDLDEPCSKGEVEAVIIAHTYAMSLGQQGRHRSCSANKINYPAEILTLEGHSKVIGEGNHYTIDKDKVVCLNSNNKEKPKPPYYWANKEATCRDWKLRYCCKNLWGEAIPVQSLAQGKVKDNVKYSATDVIVDAPFIKTLFDGCEWKDFKSVSSGQGSGDLESRELNSKFSMASVCKMDKFASFFIDTRTVADDTPWDETGTVITKNTAIYGFYCDNKNNQHLDKQCENYKVRFCCKIEKASEWGQWSEWSSCTKTCGGGVHKRTRVCNKKEGNKDSCFMDGPSGDIRYREMTESCSELPCPKDLQWQEWLAWTSCSATCGSGTRIRRRACFPPKNGGKDCPPPDNKSYTLTGKCSLKNCVDAQWTPWTSWSTCSVSCGLGTKTRRRTCVDIANDKAPIGSSSLDMCLGPAIHQDDCHINKCPDRGLNYFTVDGGLTKWQNWGECSLACGPEGYRKRMRYCTNPFPMHGGKDCKGDKEEKGPCKNMPECPIHCLFSEWGDWSKCSHSCGNSKGAGTRIRNRYIAVEAKFGGMKCYGDVKEIDSCIHCATKPKGYDGPCINFCPVDCLWSKWTSWTGTCRVCYHKGQEKFAELLSRNRQRFVERDAQYGGKQCHAENGKIHKIADGLETQTHKCKIDVDTLKCPAKPEDSYWSAWEGWGTCTSLCGRKGYEVRKRTCVGGLEGHKRDKSGCKGKDEENRLCLSPCPTEGWTEWDMWSPCQVTCGVGQSARKRTCQEDNKKDIPEEQKTCKGIQREQRPCDSGSCTKYESFETAGKDVTGLVTGWRSGSHKIRNIKDKKNLDSTDGQGEVLKGESNSKKVENQTEDDDTGAKRNHKDRKVSEDVELKTKTNSDENDNLEKKAKEEGEREGHGKEKGDESHKEVNPDDVDSHQKGNQSESTGSSKQSDSEKSDKKIPIDQVGEGQETEKQEGDAKHKPNSEKQDELPKTNKEKESETDGSHGKDKEEMKARSESSASNADEQKDQNDLKVSDRDQSETDHKSKSTLEDEVNQGEEDKTSDKKVIQPPNEDENRRLNDSEQGSSPKEGHDDKESNKTDREEGDKNDRNKKVQEDDEGVDSKAGNMKHPRDQEPYKPKVAQELPIGRPMAEERKDSSEGRKGEITKDKEVAESDNPEKSKMRSDLKDHAPLEREDGPIEQAQSETKDGDAVEGSDSKQKEDTKERSKSNDKDLKDPKGTSEDPVARDTEKGVDSESHKPKEQHDNLDAKERMHPNNDQESNGTIQPKSDEKSGDLHKGEKESDSGKGPRDSEDQ